MVNILHLELSNSVGGIETFLMNVYRNIDRNKYHFDFITSYENPALGKDFTEMGCRIYKIASCVNFFKYINDLKDIIIKNNYDIVHIHKNSAINILPIIIAKKYANKVIIHSHNTRPSKDCRFNFIHYLNRLFLKDCSYRLACSEMAGKWLYGRKTEFNVIKNGIDLNKYLFDYDNFYSVRQAFSIPYDALVIGHVGRFTEQKNHKKLIEIFENIFKLNPNSYLLLIGDGAKKSEIQEIVNFKEYSNNVLFLGNRSDVNIILQSFDAFIMPSLYEGMPIVSIEAQATGCKTFLSSFITHEAEVTENVVWFEVDDSSCEISELVINSLREKYDRKKANNQVRVSKYDIMDTVKSISSVYDYVVRK